MGIEYTIANTRNKTMYELGKGSWYEIMDPLPEEAPMFLYRDSFISYVSDIWRDYYAGYQMTPKEIEEEMKGWAKVADIIFDFIDGADPEKDLKLCNDSDDSIYELKLQGYIYIGSRYTGIPDYHNYIVDLNRRSKSSIDISKLDFNWPIKRIKNLLVYC